MKTPREKAFLAFFRGVSSARHIAHAMKGRMQVSKGIYSVRIPVCCLFVCLAYAGAQEPSKQQLDRAYQTAVANYDAGQYADAASQLEALLPYATKSYVVHELLGMVYASLNENDKALDQLKLAVQLQPNSAVARTNLGTLLLHTGRHALAGEQFVMAQRLEPASYDANHDLGEFYVQAGRLADAQPLLAKAQAIQPSAYDNGYDLVMADYMLGHLAEGQQVAKRLLVEHNTGELHNLLAKIDEKDGKFLDAANEYEVAGHMDPSEDNLFDWGSEMLLHRTYEPAITIFKQATLRYPKSPRLFIGLGLALYSRGKYDEAVKALLSAADLAPTDARCYYFLSKAYDLSPGQADEVTQHFIHYAELEPDNALAQYYCALSLWKGKRAQNVNVDSATVETLLKKSIALDGKIAQSHLQLGDLYADQREYEKSIPEYVRAIELDPNLSDAHYRLGTDYVHVGKRDLAQKEFAVYQKLRAEHLAEMDKERAEVQQFVYSSTSSGVAHQ